MKVKIQQSNEEINSIGGVSLIGGLFNCLKSVKWQIQCRHQKSNTAASLGIAHSWCRGQYILVTGRSKYTTRGHFKMHHLLT
jgi:hypothetical protein